MNRSSDRMLARSLLEARERGISFGLHVRRNALMYGMFATYFIVCLAILAWMQLWFVFYLVTGMALGSLLKDIGWVRATRKVLPFTVAVTDWDKVERLANDEQRA
ncbi:MAG: hypothetical protein ACKOC4_10590 [Planctomycetia bacterium]